MGFFPDMAKAAPKGTYKTFAVHVNDLGECVVQQLNDKGETVNFVACENTGAMLLQLVRQISPNALVKMNWLTSNFVEYLFPRCYCETWAELCALLNGKNRAAKTRAQAFLEANYVTVMHYIEKNYQENENYTRTKLGVEFDTKFYPDREPKTEQQG